MSSGLTGRKIVLGVAGGIAAYKAADLCSRLGHAGAQVRVAMSPAAQQFVAPLTFEALSQYRVYGSVLKEPASYEMEHISWARWADVLVFAPATADLIARMAAGLGDDPLTTLYLSFEGPVVIAPSMNSSMLQTSRHRDKPGDASQQGSADRGNWQRRPRVWRRRARALAEPEEIVRYLEQLDYSKFPQRAPTELSSAVPDAGLSADMDPHSAASAAPLADRDDSMTGLTVLVTSGPTHEYVDPVRFMTNPSSGKMGAALAREAARRGAKVHLVSGPVGGSSLPVEAEIHRVTTAEQMLQAVESLAPQVDLFIFAAAVSDYRAAQSATTKIKRSGNSIALRLTENPDIAQAIGHTKRDDQVTVGFAAETDDVETNALGKLARKKLDAIVANNVADPRIGFDRDENEVTIYLTNGMRANVSRRSKAEVAKEIFNTVMPLMKKQLQ